MRYLDVETMHAVHVHLASGDAGARPFARFQRQEEVAAVGLDAAQLVQLGVEAVGDDAAFAEGSVFRVFCSSSTSVSSACSASARLAITSGFVGRVSTRHHYCRVGWKPDLQVRFEKLRQGQRRVAQAEVARAGAAQRDARGDAFHIDAG